MEKEHKKLFSKVSLIIIGIAVLLMAGSVGYYLGLSNMLNLAGLEISLTMQTKSIKKVSDNAGTATQSSNTTATTPATTTPAAATPTTTSPTASWKTYNNTKYSYGFKYPADYVLTNNCKSTSCLSEQQGGDSVALMGDLSAKGWPNIEIAHYDTEFYNPPVGTDLMKWIPQYFPSYTAYMPKEWTYMTRDDGHLVGIIDLTVPKSPQAYSSRQIYYIWDNKLFSITMTDVDSAAAAEFYKNWFGTFNVNGVD
ncbi:MAG: hypothetical protein Q7S37_02000 [bacterium]|nr:hypothetical protein [bacterium]